MNVESLKKSRDKPAVLKLGLMQVRSRCPTVPILVVEGVEDKSIYSQWVGRIRGDFRPEYYVCHGKRQVLMLHDTARRDLNDLIDNVFFFIDRDFDDYAGYQPSKSLFMTDMYSTENYLVNDIVLDDILSIEFHCNGYPDVREKIKNLFNEVHKNFLAVTKDLNFRLFVSKLIPIPRKGNFPTRISHIAALSLNKVEAQVREAADVIGLEREPTRDEEKYFADEFRKLEPERRYRGKFSYLFFERWLDLLTDDYVSRRTLHFGEIEETARAKRYEISLSTLASRSPMPLGLDEFIQAI